MKSKEQIEAQFLIGLRKLLNECSPGACLSIDDNRIMLEIPLISNEKGILQWEKEIVLGSYIDAKTISVDIGEQK